MYKGTIWAIVFAFLCLAPAACNGRRLERGSPSQRTQSWQIPCYGEASPGFAQPLAPAERASPSAEEARVGVRVRMHQLPGPHLLQKVRGREGEETAATAQPRSSQRPPSQQSSWWGAKRRTAPGTRWGSSVPHLAATSCQACRPSSYRRERLLMGARSWSGREARRFRRAHRRTYRCNPARMGEFRASEPSLQQALEYSGAEGQSITRATQRCSLVCQNRRARWSRRCRPRRAEMRCTDAGKRARGEQAFIPDWQPGVH